MAEKEVRTDDNLDENPKRITIDKQGQNTGSTTGEDDARQGDREFSDRSGNASAEGQGSTSQKSESISYGSTGAENTDKSISTGAQSSVKSEGGTGGGTREGQPDDKIHVQGAVSGSGSISGRGKGEAGGSASFAGKSSGGEGKSGSFSGATASSRNEGDRSKTSSSASSANPGNTSRSTSMSTSKDQEKK